MLVTIVVFLAASLVVAEIGRRGAAGTLPRNHVAGIRLPSTMRDDESWAIAHRAGGPATLVTGVVSAGAAVVAACAWFVSGDGAAGAIVIGTALFLLGGVLYSGWKGVSALRDGPR